MADPKPSSDGLHALSRTLKATGVRMRELEKADGTQLADLVQRVNDALENLNAQVQAAIAANSYTSSQIDSKLGGKSDTSHKHDGADLTSGTIARPVSTTGGVTGGSVTGGTVTSNGNLNGVTLYASGAPGYNITGTRVAAWWQSADGRAGTASSSERYKTHITAAEIDPEAILSVMPVWYQYTAALEHAEWRRTCGPPYTEWDPTAKAPLELGMIAERLHEAGLWPFVVYERDQWGRLKRTADGEPIPDGIHYINWGVALQVVARWERDQRVALADRVDDLTRRLEALES
jgi:hypothetical protein